MRENEHKVESQNRIITQIEEELHDLKQANKKLTSENEELTTNVLCFQQETAS